MTTTTENSIASLTIKETYDKPRKCGGCERRRKVNLVEIAHADGTVFTSQMCADCYDALKARVGVEVHQPTRMEQELDAILEETERDWEYDAEIVALDDVERVGQPAIGPEFGEMLPKIFTDEIRQRVAAQHIAGATVPELAAAWGRTPGSVKKIIARFPTGQPAIA